MRLPLFIAAALMAAPALADGLQLPDPAPDGAAVMACVTNGGITDEQRLACSEPIFELCRTEAEAAYPDEHWRVIHLHCAQREHNAWDVVLNAAYRDLKPKAEAEGLGDALKTTQRNWIAYRDANCSWKEPILFGNNADLDKPTCLKLMTARRAVELLDDLAYFP